jgi:peptidyl-prolyl cis-trans isomerase C/foldase protein PrsA
VPIPLAALQRELDRLRLGNEAAEEGEVPGPAPEPRAPAPPRSASSTEELRQTARALLGPLIDQQLLVARGRELGVQVSLDELQRAAEELADSAPGAAVRFPERLARAGMSSEGMQEALRMRLVATRTIRLELQKKGIDRPTAPELKAWADAHGQELDAPEEVRALHVMLSSAEAAKSVLDQLRKGASFEVLAAAQGQTPDASRGGDLGYFPRGKYPRAFDDTCFALKPGQLSGVVRSPYGFHVFKLLDKRARRRRSLEEIRPALEKRLWLERRAAGERELLESLRAKAKIAIDEAVLAQVK